MNNLIEVKSVNKDYDNGLITALKDINLKLEEGKIYALMGTSGCGKSTLLNLIGTLDIPTSGEIYYEGKSLNDVGIINEFRREFIGFIFQFHHLIPVLTLRENIESALLSNLNISANQRTERATKLLEQMGILHRSDSYASHVSGGERQRAAIARALINNPKVILADEPTGNVDSTTAKIILQVMKENIQKNNATMLIATHDSNIASIADIVIKMKDSKIISIDNNFH